jgi:hypothetical protein
LFHALPVEPTATRTQESIIGELSSAKRRRHSAKARTKGRTSAGFMKTAQRSVSVAPGGPTQLRTPDSRNDLQIPKPPSFHFRQLRSYKKKHTAIRLVSRCVEKWGWECATLSSPVTGLRRSTQRWAASSPTLFATASGICGLAAGPAGRFPRTAFRVRPLSPVRQTPAGA